MTLGPVSPTAMVLAAGKGKRLRPITDRFPKPLVEVNGRTLLDTVLDRLEQAGIKRVVVNIHYRGGQIRDHLEARPRPETETIEEEELLETGGGVANALPHLGPSPFVVVNGDVLWYDGPSNALHRLAAAWDDKKMDALLLLQPVVRARGYEGPGDFFMDPLGLLRRRGEREVAPFVFAGVQILHERLFENRPEGPFSLNLLYDRAAEGERLYGIAHIGKWYHVGTPESLEQAASAFAINPNDFYRP